MNGIPDRFLSPFETLLPPRSVIGDAISHGRRFGDAYVSNLVEWTQFESARLIDRFGVLPEAIPAAQELFGYAAETIGAQGDFSAGAVVSDALQGFQAAATALGAFDDVPIVGWVIGIGIAAYDIGRVVWREVHRKEIEADPFQYNELADEYWQRDVLAKMRAGDMTDIFLPWNDATGGIEILNTELESEMKVSQQIALARGNELGLGFVPGTSGGTRGWTYNTAYNPKTRGVMLPWLAYAPGTQQAGVTAWNTVLANGRPCFMVDAPRLRAAWDDYWSRMMGYSQYNEYSKKTRIRLTQAISPFSYLSFEESQKIPADYRQVVSSGWDGSYWEGEARMEPTMKGATRWIIDRQLSARQAAHLSTLTVAYVSDKDPAFRDPELADLLDVRRGQFLQQQAAVDAVDLSMVVDPAFRQAIAVRRGAGGEVKAPEPGDPKAPTKIQAFHVPDPEPKGQALPATPMTPQGVGEKGGGGLLLGLGALAAGGTLLALRRKGRRR